MSRLSLHVRAAMRSFCAFMHYMDPSERFGQWRYLRVDSAISRADRVMDVIGSLFYFFKYRSGSLTYKI